MSLFRVMYYKVCVSPFFFFDLGNLVAAGIKTVKNTLTKHIPQITALYHIKSTNPAGWIVLKAEEKSTNSSLID